MSASVSDLIVVHIYVFETWTDILLWKWRVHSSLCNSFTLKIKPNKNLKKPIICKIETLNHLHVLGLADTSQNNTSLCLGSKHTKTLHFQLLIPVSVKRSLWTADCGAGVKCKLRVKCRMIMKATDRRPRAKREKSQPEIRLCSLKFVEI